MSDTFEIKVENHIFVIEGLRIFRKEWKYYFYLKEIKQDNKSFQDETANTRKKLQKEWVAYSKQYILAFEKFERLSLLK